MLVYNNLPLCLLLTDNDLLNHIQGLFKKLRNFYHKTYISPTRYLHLSPSKYSAPLLIHCPQRFFHFLKQSWNACFGIAFRSLSKFYFISSIVSNLRPFKVDISLGNRKKSASARSGEQDGCGMTVIPVFVRKSCSSVSSRKNEFCCNAMHI